MSDGNPIFLVETNDFARKQLMAVLVRYELDQSVKIVDCVPNEADSTVIEVNAPYRVGVVLDRISAALSETPSDLVDIGAGRLIDRRLANYYAHEGAEAVRLTEKEVALLLLLAEAKGGFVSREQLLDDIWQYAQDVETHTLETHIYRLRQKIEDDPADPRILKTSDAGYYLSAE